MKEVLTIDANEIGLIIDDLSDVKDGILVKKIIEIFQSELRRSVYFYNLHIIETIKNMGEKKIENIARNEYFKDGEDLIKKISDIKIIQYEQIAKEIEPLLCSDVIIEL